jgi:NAD(P)-dependent dehydrogenase (short-subunit alcohol dehydrogenase family)
MGKLTGKIALVTGSGKGIGKATAARLLKEGATVVLNGRNQEKLEAARKELSAPGYPVRALVADVSESEPFTELIQKIIDEFGRLDILVLNAGLSTYGNVERVSDDAIDNVLKINSSGPFRCARVALPHLRASRGSIVFISSLAGLYGLPGGSLYSMSKMALTALAQSLKLELEGTGVHVGILYVGFTVNEPDKTTVAPDGSIRPLQDRPGWIQQPVEKVARRVVSCIKRRRFSMVLSPLGKIMAFFVRYFPRLFMLTLRLAKGVAGKLTAD